MSEEKVVGKLLENKIRVWSDYDEIYSEKYYGKKFEDHLDLSLPEAMHLVDRKDLTITKEEKEVTKEELYDIFCEIDDEFAQKYAVYSDLRERGFIVKSGFKFGTHFRVYPRGVNPYKEGPKTQKEHTKWVVHAVPEDYTLSYQEMSRAVRLAQNIRATMLWAVVDSEKNVVYYEFERIKP